MSDMAEEHLFLVACPAQAQSAKSRTQWNSAQRSARASLPAGCATAAPSMRPGMGGRRFADNSPWRFLPIRHSSRRSRSRIRSIDGPTRDMLLQTFAQALRDALPGLDTDCSVAKGFIDRPYLQAPTPRRGRFGIVAKLSVTAFRIMVSGGSPPCCGRRTSGTAMASRERRA